MVNNSPITHPKWMGDKADTASRRPSRFSRCQAGLKTRLELLHGWRARPDGWEETMILPQDWKTKTGVAKIVELVEGILT